jgi:hypothetical protein
VSSFGLRNVNPPILPGVVMASADGTLLAALADESVADPSDSIHVQDFVTFPDTVGDDVGRVEHVRQSRLKLWQRLNG